MLSGLIPDMGVGGTLHLVTLTHRNCAAADLADPRLHPVEAHSRGQELCALWRRCAVPRKPLRHPVELGIADALQGPQLESGWAPSWWLPVP